MGLFNILQEGDVQIKGYPVRLPLDVMMVFSANPEDYTARGKIITPLKDRIGSEIRTHYPASRQAAHGHHRPGSVDGPRSRAQRQRQPSDRFDVPGLHPRDRRGGGVPGPRGLEGRQAIGRQPAAADQRAGERRLQRRAARAASPTRRSWSRASPTSTRPCRPSPGKFELEYEGELRGADNVASDLIRAAVGNVFNGYFDGADLRQVVEWFDLGGTLQVSDTTPAEICSWTRRGPSRGCGRGGAAGLTTHASTPALASAIDFVLEGLNAQKKISRNDEWKYSGGELAAARTPCPSP